MYYLWFLVPLIALATILKFADWIMAQPDPTDRKQRMFEADNVR